jgi:ribonuclease R
MGARTHFVGQVVHERGAAVVRDGFTDGEPSAVTLVEALPEGTWVEIWREHGDAPPSRVHAIAKPGSARASLLALVREQGLDPAHPDDVEEQSRALVESPGLDDPELVDRTAWPFVTVDGPGTRDLDQALFVEAEGDGFVVHYAIADAAWYVRPGTPLFDEALRRGASFYLPGLSVPMLPRSLSEGVISLNPRVDRRALLFSMHVDGNGECTRTEFERARVRSRAQLTFAQVQALVDGKDGHGIDDPDVARSLHALAAVGDVRIRADAERDLVRHHHEEIRVALDDQEGLDFVVIAELRDPIERCGEQLSLMCNIEGARLLRAGARDAGLVQPVYRVHASPAPERIADLVATIDAVVEHHRLPELRWIPAHESLADYLARIPRHGEHGRIGRALSRQAMMINVRSTFAAEPGPHFGIGADVYARFSAPMREIVGVYVHKEAWEALRREPPGSDDERLRGEVIEAANRAKERQRSLTHGANLLVLDRMFVHDATMPLERRPVRAGTVMGIAERRLYVRLDQPAVDVKVYDDAFEGGAVAHVTSGGRPRDVALGDLVHVRLARHDPRRRRWILELVDGEA